MELEYLIIMILRFTKFQTYVCRLAEKSVAEEKENDKREREKAKKKSIRNHVRAKEAILLAKSANNRCSFYR